MGMQVINLTEGGEDYGKIRIIGGQTVDLEVHEPPSSGLVDSDSISVVNMSKEDVKALIAALVATL